MRTSIIVLVILVVVGGGYIVLRSPGPTTTKTTSGPAEVPTAAVGQPLIQQEISVTYTDSGYSPASLDIKVGDTVTFKNESSQNMWPASAKHPTHTLYPTTGGCIGSTFDGCKGVPPGQSWSFKFDIKGDWKYHDHLTPTYFGSIIVE